MTRVSVLLSASLMMAACAGLEGVLVDPGAAHAIPVGDLDLEDAPAVILKREVGLRFMATNGNMEWTFHDVARVDSEAGLTLANLRIELSPGDELQEIFARTIEPSGAVHDIDDLYAFDDDAKAEGETAKVKVVRIPGVSVGCILEYAFLIRKDGLFSTITRPIAAPLPIKRYELNAYVSKSVAFEVRTYNTTVQPAVARDGTGFSISIVANDVPATREEAFGPSQNLYDPWWAFAVRQYGNGTPLDRWDRALKGYADYAYDDAGDTHFDGYSPDVDAPEAKKVVDKIAYALDFVRSATRFGGFTGGLYETRPLKTVVRSKRANAIERAYLLWLVLDELGVRTDLAPSVRFMSRAVDESFYASTWFNHLVLRVPRQDDLAAPLFVDPSCDACGVGELPAWSKNAFAVALTKGRTATGKFDVDAEVVTVTGAPLAPGTATHIAIDASLDEQGRMGGSIARTVTGDRAIAASRRLVTARAAANTDAAATELRRRFADVTGKIARQPSCDVRLATCVDQEIDFSKALVGAPSPERMIIPLSFLRAPYDDALQDRRRHADLFVREDETVEETLRLVVPAGMRIDEAPSDARVESAAFVSTVKVRLEGATLVVVRRLEARRGRYPVKDYERLRAPVRAFAAVPHTLVALRRAPAAAEAADPADREPSAPVATPDAR